MEGLNQYLKNITFRVSCIDSLNGGFKRRIVSRQSIKSISEAFLGSFAAVPLTFPKTRNRLQ